MGKYYGEPEGCNRQSSSRIDKEMDEFYKRFLGVGFTSKFPQSNPTLSTRSSGVIEPQISNPINYYLD